jgi:Sec-independent protein translocase protein TatA
MPGMPVDLLFVLIVILVLVLMWKGPKNLPKLGEAFGRGVKEARVEASKAQAEIQGRVVDDETPPTTSTTPPSTAPGTPDEQRPA